MQWQGPEGLTKRLDERNYAQVATAVSVPSDVWRTEAGEQLSRFVKHMEARYGDHIIGYHFAGQNTHEWFYVGSRADKLNCCERVFTEAWRRWLREKYGSDHALRVAWGDRAVAFATAAAPTYDERLRATFEYFRDPARERKTIDFHEYQNVAVAEAVENFARIVKRDSRKLAVCFYGYLFEHGTVPRGVQQSGHLALGHLLKCPDIDIYTTGDDVIEADERFVAIHAGSSGDKVISLPRRARVHEALTGTTVGNRIETWSVEMNRGDTRLYSIDYGRPGSGE